MQKGLLRQLRRCFDLTDESEVAALLAATSAAAGTTENSQVKALLAGFADFVQRVDASYEQYERDLALRTRSLELSSSELSGANDKLRDELASRQRVLDSLHGVLHDLLPHDTALARLDRADLEALTDRLSALVREREVSRQALDNQKFALDQHAIVSITDTDGNIIYANDKFCEISGYERAELIGQNHRLVNSSVHPSAFFAELWETITSGRVWHGEVCNRAKDGSLHWLNATIVPFLGADGLPEQYIAIRTDISDRKATEARLQEQLDFVEKVLEAIPLPIYIKDCEGRYLKLNKAFEELLGIRGADFLGRTVHDLLPRETAEPMAAMDRALFARPGTQSFETRIHTGGGRIYDAIYRKTTLTRPDGGVSGLLGTIIDITERKAGEVALRQAKEVAEAASRAKSDFLANMSHEIRTPMNGIIGMTDLALGTSLDTEQREYLNIVRSSSEALLTLLNDILDFSKIEAGKLQVENIAFDLQQVVAETLKPLALKAREKDLELICDIAADVPTHVIGDPGRLRQVLVNLVGNAIKFTERGEIALLLEAEQRSSDQFRLHLAVRDTGIGIPPDKLEHIFEAFAQEDSSTTRRYGGTGLGLSISCRLVQLMGGRLWVESQQGRGSTFHGTVALGIDPRPLVFQHPPVVLRGRRLLVVDDNATNRRVLVAMLERWEITVEAVAGGPSALARLAEGAAFDAILLDAHMPDMDGFELAATIRERYGNSAPLMLMLSSGALRGDAQRCQASGIAGYFSKPITATELLAALGSVFVRSERRDIGGEPALVTRHSLREAGRDLDVLLVEDHPVNQKLAITLLEKWGHRVTVANNGQEALDICADRSFDVILMDVQMPVMGGIEATRHFRQREAARGATRTPVVAMTANAMQGDREACLAAGMDDYISKPVRAKELLEILVRIGGTLANPVDAELFDYGAALREADRETVEIIAGVFLETWQRDLQRLQEAIDGGDAASSERIAHSLKGTLATFCARPAAGLAADIEQQARRHELHLCHNLCESLADEMERLQPYLQAIAVAG